MTELQSESIAKLMPALLNAQENFGPAVRNATNPHFQSKFVDLAGVLDAVVPALAAERILLSQPTDYVDGVTVLRTRLIHESGEWVGSVYPVASGVGNPQAAGSALTYARRYTALAICGIAPEDDDGNAAAQQHTERVPTVADKAAAEQTERATTLAAIKRVADELGWSKSDVEDDYAERYPGEQFGQASGRALSQYLAILEQPALDGA